MVDSHTIAVGVTLMGVAFSIRSMTAVLNATSRLIQAVSRLTKIVVAFLKTPSITDFLCIFKKTHRITSGDGFLKNHQVYVLSLRRSLLTTC
jgi:hypothetical protein